LGILVKRSAFAIGFLFVWNIIEAITKGVLTYKIFPDSKIAENITQFMPLESMSNLIVEPFSRLSVVKNIETAIGGAGNTKDYSVHFTSILIVLVWTAIFMFLSYKLLKKRDL
jgi:ABC-type transport system involved in multi-copper enzyme maturation permease subunit